MNIQKQNIDSFVHLIGVEEDSEYQKKLLSATMFPYMHALHQVKCFKAVLNFSLKDVGFNKKKALIFFLAVELLTNQKCIATLSSKNVLAWKLRKGALVGCKVTLRNKNLYNFLDTIALAFPRMENFKGIIVSKSKRTRMVNWKVNTLSFPLQELVMFYPIELSLGINTEVRKADFQLSFSTYNLQEQIFLLTASKIPVNQ